MSSIDIMNGNEHVVTEIHIYRHKRSLKIRTRLMIVKINLRQHEFYELSANMPTKRLHSVFKSYHKISI